MTGYQWRDPARHHPPPQPADPAEAALAAITRAVKHPDTVTARRMYETNDHWQARAILTAAAPFVRARILASLRGRAGAGDELARVVADLIEEDTP